MRLAHRACPSCGKYGGRVVTDVVAEAARAARRNKRREKEMMASGQIPADSKKEKKGE